MMSYFVEHDRTILIIVSQVVIFFSVFQGQVGVKIVPCFPPVLSTILWSFLGSLFVVAV